VRKKIAVAVAVASVGLSGLAVSVPAFASSTPTPSTTSTTSTPGTTAPGAKNPLDSLKSALSGLVKDKTLTQAQADKVASTLSAAGVRPGGPGGHGGPGGPDGPGGGHGFGGDLSTAAKALGLSEADLRTALQSGQTLAQVAKTRNVSVDTLVAALVKAEKARIAQAVTDGRLTQAEADTMLGDLSARITERVNSTRPDHGGGRGPGDSGSAPSPTPTPSSSSSN
jgi:hypothetical protein